MAVPVVDLLNNSDSSSDEDFSEDSENSYSSEDESMEDEPSESEITTATGYSYHWSLVNILSLILSLWFRLLLTETETKEEEEEEEEFWIKYPYLKSFLSTIVAQGLIPEYYVYERAKLIGEEKAKELNERGEALFLKELEACKDKCELVASAIIAMKSVKWFFFVSWNRWELLFMILWIAFVLTQSGLW